MFSKIKYLCYDHVNNSTYITLWMRTVIFLTVFVNISDITLTHLCKNSDFGSLAFLQDLLHVFLTNLKWLDFFFFFFFFLIYLQFSFFIKYNGLTVY